MRLKSILFGILAVIAIIAVATYIFVGTKKETGLKIVTITPTVTLLPTRSANSTSTLMGYVFTSGKPATSDYQITYLNHSYSNLTGVIANIEGAYLINSNIDFSAYWGKCVTIDGTYPSNINSADIESDYNRVAFNVVSIQESILCALVPGGTIATDSHSVTFSGTVAKNDRPAPDITYDFKLILDTPQLDSHNAQGINKSITEVLISPSNASNFNQLLGKVGQGVTITGNWVSGFSETNYVLVETIN